MKDRKSSEGRRKLLKTIAIASGAVIAGKNLPESWDKPVVNSVLLPAHAQTSPPPSVTFNYSGQNVTSASIDSGRHFAEWISDSLIEDAHAGVTPGNNPIIEMSAAVNGSMATVLFTPAFSPNAWALFQSDLPTNGTAGTVNLGPGGNCGITWPDPGGGGPQAVRIVGYSTGDPTITVEITGGSGGGGTVRQYVLSEGPGTATAVACAAP